MRKRFDAKAIGSLTAEGKKLPGHHVLSQEEQDVHWSARQSSQTIPHQTGKDIGGATLAVSRNGAALGQRAPRPRAAALPRLARDPASGLD